MNSSALTLSATVAHIDERAVAHSHVLAEMFRVDAATSRIVLVIGRCASEVTLLDKAVCHVVRDNAVELFDALILVLIVAVVAETTNFDVLAMGAVANTDTADVRPVSDFDNRFSVFRKPRLSNDSNIVYVDIEPLRRSIRRIRATDKDSIASRQIIESGFELCRRGDDRVRDVNYGLCT